MRIVKMVAALLCLCIAPHPLPAASDEETVYFEEAKRFIAQGKLTEAYERSIMLMVYGDHDLAHDLLRAVAEAGYADAQFAMAEFMTIGAGGIIGTGSDDWLRAAAHQGHRQAQKELGQALVLEGRDETHWIEGLMWLLVASAGQDEDTEGVTELARSLLTDEQVSRAERRAQRCLASNLSECGVE